MNKYLTEYELWGKMIFRYTMVIKPYKLKPFVPLPESEKAREDLDHKWFSDWEKERQTCFFTQSLGTLCLVSSLFYYPVPVAHKMQSS